MKILIVDDEEIICESLKLDMERMQLGKQCDIYTANSAKEALIIYEEQHPEFVITDIKMPNGSGLSLIEKIRKTGSRCAILVLSAYDDYDYVRQAFLSGADDYILKPISFSELDLKVKAHLVKSPIIKEKIDTDNFKMQDALNYIDKNMQRDISMSELAEHVSISYSHFSKLFREHTKISFPNYLLSVRMKKAKEYLVDPYVKISSIAKKVGYKHNPQHFSRDFNKYTGLSPSEYREKLIVKQEPGDLI